MSLVTLGDSESIWVSRGRRLKPVEVSSIKEAKELAQKLAKEGIVADIEVRIYSRYRVEGWEHINPSGILVRGKDKHK